MKFFDKLYFQLLFCSEISVFLGLITNAIINSRHVLRIDLYNNLLYGVISALVCSMLFNFIIKLVKNNIT